MIVGTAGHIDHGKSSLMKALTGRDPDRLKEEKQRGITIELGYVFLETPDGSTVSFIDVPGHEKFIRTMVAGVSTVDCFMLVVSADEGVMPQTLEHLDILRLLEVDTGVVALSKCDLVEEELQELAEEEVREALHGTPAQDAPIVRVSAMTGQGLEELRARLLKMVGELPSRSSEGRFRLPIDRVFSMKGFGTVVCGTGLSGTVKAGDTVEIQPGGRQYRVREIGVNDHRRAPLGSAGDRIALNLTGLNKEDVERGSVIGEPGWLRALSSLDTLCSVLPADVDLQPRQRVRLHIGTAEIMARAIPVKGAPVGRGSRGFVHFQLEHPVVAVPGDRFVIRRYSPVVTIGGGVVLDTGTPKVRARFREVRLQHLELLSRGDLADVLKEAMEGDEHGSLRIHDFMASSGCDPCEMEHAIERLLEEETGALTGEGQSRVLVLRSALDGLKKKVCAAVRAVHRAVPLAPGLGTAFLARNLPGGTPQWLIRFALGELLQEGVLERRDDFLAEARFPSGLEGEQLAEARRIARIVDDLGFEGAGVPMKDERREDIDALLARGILIQLGEGVVTTFETLEKAVSIAGTALDPRGFRLGEFREALGVSRRFALMWAELLDRRGVTRRTGELRVLNRPP